MENTDATLSRQMAQLQIPPEKEQQQRRLPEWVIRRIQELPLFNGTDSARWISSMEHYFYLNNIDDSARKMEVIPRCLSGQALAWFQLIQRSEKPPGSWDEFRKDFFTRFENGDTMYERFLSIQQDVSVRKYCSQFMFFGGLLPDIPDSILEAIFMNGLKAEIRTAVRMLQPKGIEEIIRKARFVEDNYEFAQSSAIINTSFEVVNTSFEVVNSSCKLMKFKGTINEKEVVFKVVSGSSNSFMSTTLATELNLPLDKNVDYSVGLITGKTIKGYRICGKVQLEIQNLTMFEDFFVHDMEGKLRHEVVLGVTWLKTLGYTEFNFKDLTMKMKVGKMTVTLRGDPSL